MLEGLVASLLNRFLGLYITDFDPKYLNVGIWSGDVKLRNLELRREALDQLKLPINVTKGHLGQLTLRIPWSNLRGQPVQVYIEDVFVLASPKEDAEWDENEEKRRTHALKMEKLERAEISKERIQDGLSQEEQQKNQSFTESLVTKIVDNLQISIKNIHIRYEDSISTSDHPFALGITLQEFSAISTDEDWKPTFVQNSLCSTHKLATLGALAVYWNTDTQLLGSGKKSEHSNPENTPHGEALREFKGMINEGHSQDNLNHKFVLKPVNGLAKIEINKSGKIDKPQINSRLVFDEIGMVLDEDQYRDAIMLVDLFHYFFHHQEYIRLRPKNGRPKQDPRAWLTFACNAILCKIHDRNRRWSWEYFRERRDDRIRYIELYKRKKQQNILTANENTELINLEWKRDYDDLRFWRSLAMSQLKKENTVLKKTNLTKRNQSWAAWVWGSKADKEEEIPETIITEEQKKEFYNAIDWDEKTALAEIVDLPKETVKLQIGASLNTGSFTLKRGRCQREVELLGLYCDGFRANFLQRPESFLVDISLEGLRVNDGTVADSLFKQIVKVKDAPNTPTRKMPLDKDLDAEESADPFFQFKFEKNPMDGVGDLSLSGRMKPLEIIWNPQFLVEVTNFFQPPERYLESVGALMETAGATVESLRQQTRAGLEFALEEHKTLSAILDLQAPLIVIPHSITEEKSVCLILDAGHISVNSQIVDKDTLKQIQEKQEHSYTNEDQRCLESLMYDKFLVKFSSAQLLIGPSIQEAKAQIDKRDELKMMHIVEKINIDFMVETSIIPKAPNIAKVRVSGRLPLLHVSVSDEKYKSFMRIIEVALPKFREAEDLSHSVIKNDMSIKAQSQSNFSKTEKYKVSDSAHELLADQDGSEHENSYNHESINIESNESLLFQQHNFELKFEVDRLKGSLFRSDIKGQNPDKLLVELIADNFILNLDVRRFDLTIDTSLQSLMIDDYVERTSDEFQSIISSGDMNSGNLQNLISVNIVLVSKESPEFISRWKSVNVNIKAIISTINVIVTRKTLLTLLDFILVTFKTNDTQVSNSNKQIKGPEDENTNQENLSRSKVESSSVWIKVDVKCVRMILNNDGTRLATLSLNNTDVGILVTAETLRIEARVADLVLLDDVVEYTPGDSCFRELITIQGEDLADFRYETFDPKNDLAYPGYESSIYLRAGSIKLNFLEEPFHNIIGFLVKFGKMQAIFNAARQAAANQASQIQQNASCTKIDINIKSPIVYFPRENSVQHLRHDMITAHLGEIYAQNTFTCVDDTNSSPIVMNLSAGIRNIRLTSTFNFSGDKIEQLELIDRVDLIFIVEYTRHLEGSQRPELQVESKMTNVTLHISQSQVKFLLEIAKSLPSTLEMEDELIEAEIKEQSLENVMKVVTAADSSSSDNTMVVNLGPELKFNSKNWTKLDLSFKVETISLELILAKDNEPVESLEKASLSKFSLNNTKLKLRIMADSSLESEILVHSLTIWDSRAQTKNRFRKIMTSSNTNAQQFMARVTISGGVERNLIAIVAIDSPKVIFALDYLFAIQTFVNQSLTVNDLNSLQNKNVTTDRILIQNDGSQKATLISKNKPRSDESSTGRSFPSEKSSENDQSLNIAFRINVFNAQIILIANPLDTNSDAIVLGTKQILVAQQNVTALQVSEMGIFLCRMNRFNELRLRILDNFSARSTLRRSYSKSIDIQIDIEPLVLRLSLRDILLALQIISKASELSCAEDEAKNPSIPHVEDKPLKSSVDCLTNQSLTGKMEVDQNKKVPARKNSVSLMNLSRIEFAKDSSSGKENLVANFEGMRLILIGSVHELPILDFSIKGFTLSLSDWTSNIFASTAIDLFINIYNFKKSTWEPLIEPWQLGFQVLNQKSPDLMMVNLESSKTLELTITSATIALASKSAQFLSQKYDHLSKPRVDAPYRIRNYTGFELTVWADYSGVSNEGPINLKLKDFEEAPWQFENWEKIRENITPDANNGLLGIRLEGTTFNEIDKISVHKEGLYLHVLKPQIDNILHQILVDVTVGADSVKNITFRSPLLVKNDTSIPVQMGIYDTKKDEFLRIDKIAPSECHPSPVDAAFSKKILIRPDQGLGYNWSNETLWWRDLLKKPTETITCMSDKDMTPKFYFQIHANFEKSNPLTSIYPCMEIRLFPPIELENLLPYDLKYDIYDKNTKKYWTNFLQKGSVSSVHVVNLSHLLLLSIDICDTPFKKSDFVVINCPNNNRFDRATDLICYDNAELSLRLGLHYFEIPGSGGASRISIYSPYVILNKIGISIQIKPKVVFNKARRATDQEFQTKPAEFERQKALPYMFAFEKDQRKRVTLKVGDSNWSTPQSFDTIGSTSEIILSSGTDNTEIHIGIKVEAGEGKYKMTKVVTLTPRFILKNEMADGINIREPGSSKLMNLKPHALEPLYFLQKSTMKQLSLCHPGLNNKWSSPFNISDLGTTYVKIAKSGERQNLVRIEILLEHATVFLHLSIETNHWPFAVRNESDIEFTFYQKNPDLDDDDEYADCKSKWHRIRYKVPPQSIMPYAWDYPAIKNKELIITARGSERYVKLTDIGKRTPLRVLFTCDETGKRKYKYIDLNVKANGPTQTLILSNHGSSKSLIKQKHRSEYTSDRADESEDKALKAPINFRAELCLAGVGISIINTYPIELAYITLREIKLKYLESFLQQTLAGSINWIQIDNQLYGGIFPIILYPSVVPKITKETELHPSVHTMITRVKDDSYGVLYIKYATILLQQMTLEIDEDFIYSLLEFSKVFDTFWPETTEGILCDERLDIPEPKKDQPSQNIYFELLNIQPMQLDLSFVRTNRVNVEDKIPVRNPLIFLLNVLTMTIGNINDAPVRLNALVIENARISTRILIQNMTIHYTQQALSQIHKIIGSADFLGNPVGLFNNISSGVADIFYEPYQGIIMSDHNEDFAFTVMKGTASFMKKSVFGVSDSVSKFTGSIAKGLAEASMDKEFQDYRRMVRFRNRPKHALFGITAGANSFVEGFSSGINGVIQFSLDGAEKEGFAGFIKGVGKGAIGLITKPATGLFDLASNVSEGIRNTTTVFDADELDRVRLPRFIGADGVIRPYSQREALGQFWLKQLDNGGLSKELYIAHMELPGMKHTFMVTYNLLILFENKKLVTVWKIPLKVVSSLKKQSGGLKIILNNDEDIPFLDIEEKSSLDFIYKKIGIAVDEYNQKNKNNPVQKLR